MNRLQIVDNNAQNAFSENFNTGAIGSVMLYFSGTNDAGQTGAFSDLGRVVIKRGGKTIVAADIEKLADKANILEGSNLFSSTEAGAFIASVTIPFYVKSFPQALQITRDTELVIEYTPGANQSTVFDSLQVKVLQEQTDLQEDYVYELLQDDVTPAAAVSSQSKQLLTENLAAVYLTDASSVLTSAGLRVDGAEVYSEQVKNVLQAGTLYNNRLEQTTIDMLELQVYTENEPGSLLNTSSVLIYTTSGAGTIGILRESIKLLNAV